MTSSDRDARDRAMWAGLAAWEATGEVMSDVVKARADRLRLDDYMDAVTRAARASIDGTDEEPEFANPDGTINLATIASGLRDGSIQPDTLDVAGLFSSGKVNAIYGSSTAGKTWISLDTARRLYAETGRRTVYVDAEDGPKGFAQRAIQMDESLLDALLYFPAHGGLNDPARLFALVKANDVGLVIVDSLGELLAGADGDSNQEKDVTRWLANNIRPLADLGPAVVLIDHTAKAKPGVEATQVGSFRKQAAITGNQYRAQSKVSFSRNKAGQSVLVVSKDRSGWFSKDSVAATYDFTPGLDGALDVIATIGENVAANVDESERIQTRLAVMAEVQRWEDEEVPGARGPALGASISTIRRYLKASFGRNDNVKSDREVRWLVEGGYLTEQTQGQGHYHRVARPYVPEFEAE